MLPMGTGVPVEYISVPWESHTGGYMQGQSRGGLRSFTYLGNPTHRQVVHAWETTLNIQTKDTFQPTFYGAPHYSIVNILSMAKNISNDVM